MNNYNENDKDNNKKYIVRLLVECYVGLPSLCGFFPFVEEERFLRSSSVILH